MCVHTPANVLVTAGEGVRGVGVGTDRCLCVHTDKGVQCKCYSVHWGLRVLIMYNDNMEVVITSCL